MKKKQLDILLDNTPSLNGLKKSEFIKNEENARAEKRLSEMLNKKQQKLFDKFNNQVNNKVKKPRDYSINNLKIIGITGSCGKTSVALLVHRYLISIGKKSVLYSSAYIDSPASSISRNGAFESIHLDETELLNIINECKTYEAEYLILECWEESINRGIYKNIPFDLKVLTSFAANTVDEGIRNRYFNNKLDFLASNNTPVIINLNRSEADDPECKRLDFINKIKGKQIYYGLNKPTTEGLCEKVLDYTWNNAKGWYGLKTLESTLVNMETKTFGNIMLNIHLFGISNILNAIGAFAVLDFFNEIDVTAWKEFIEDKTLYIAGRNQVISYKNRKIIIARDPITIIKEVRSLVGYLEEVKNRGLLPYNDFGYNIPLEKINNIIGVIGLTEPMVVGANQYSKEFSKKIGRNTDAITESFFGKEWILDDSVAEVYNENLDKVIISPTDLGSANYDQVVEIIKSKLTIPATDNRNRYKAILQAIMTSEPNDVILVLGRGNTSTNITTYNTVEYGSDLDFINKAIEALDSIDFE